MSNKNDGNSRLYYFIDVDLQSRQIIGWGFARKDEVEVHLTNGFHRVFLSKGQYNKLEKDFLKFSVQKIPPAIHL